MIFNIFPLPEDGKENLLRGREVCQSLSSARLCFSSFNQYACEFQGGENGHCHAAESDKRVERVHDVLEAEEAHGIEQQ